MERGNLVLRLFADIYCLSPTVVFKQVDELITRYATQHADFSHRIAQPSSDFGQHSVPRLIAVRFIYGSEAGDVEAEHEQRLIVSLRLCQLVVESRVKSPSVWESGQRIGLSARLGLFVQHRMLQRGRSEPGDQLKQMQMITRVCIQLAGV